MTNARVGIALMILPGLVAALWFTNKRRQPEFQKVTLPGEFGTVSVPACFTVEFEDDTTLLAYPKDTDHIAIRFSSISFAKVNEDEFVGKSFVRRNATENGYRFSEIGENGIATFEEDSLEDGVPMLIKYWEVGSKNTIVVISATILQARRNSLKVKKTLRHMPHILESLDVTKSHRIIETDGNKVEATVQTINPTPQEIAPFGLSERVWLEENMQQARDLSMKDGSGGVLYPKELDRIFSRWTFEQ